MFVVTDHVVCLHYFILQNPTDRWYSILYHCMWSHFWRWYYIFNVFVIKLPIKFWLVSISRTFRYNTFLLFFHSWSRHEKTCIKKHSSFFLVNFYYISNVEAICLYHKIWIIKFKKRNIAWTDESKMVSYTCVLAWQKKYCIRTV